VVESHIHFPTDLNLLWDSIRKCLDTIGLLGRELEIKGWRKLKAHYRKGKNLYYHSSEVHRKKGSGFKSRLNKSVKPYLKFSKRLSKKIEKTKMEVMMAITKGADVEGLFKELLYYKEMLDKHVDLVTRRILEDEKIPHGEKVFSIFEPHVEWISKGKSNRKVELGHMVLVTTDQYHFVVDHKVMEKEGDKQQVKPLADRLEKNWKPTHQLVSISFDRNFWTKPTKLHLQTLFDQVVMPRRGRKNAAEEVEESERQFVALRHQHSAVESNINELEQAGLNKVPDRTINGFKRYVALGVLAYNLKRLGKLLIQQRSLSTLKGYAVAA